jgi:hypothetical protein
MPEFDEETHKRKNRSNRDLAYEPGKNADRYKSKQPGSKKSGKSDENSSSLWVEAATSAYSTPKGSEKPRRDGTPNNTKGPRRNNRRRGNRGKRKLTLLEKVLRFLGIKPKAQKGRGNQQKRKGGKPQDNRNQQKGNKPRGERNQNNRGRGGNRQPRSDKPRSESEENSGKGGNRRRRSRKPRDEGENAESRGPKPEGSAEKRSPRPKREPRRREEGNSERPPRSEDRKPESKPRIESIAAPKTEGASIALGAIEFDSPKKDTVAESNEAAAKPRRGRRRNANQRPTATESSAKPEFVPHPIDISEPKEGSKKEDS